MSKPLKHTVWCAAIILLAMACPSLRAADVAPPTTMPFAGRVVDPDGKAVAGARVEIYGSNAERTDSLPFSSITSDEKGSFQLMNPSPQSTLVIRAANFGLEARTITQATEGTEPVEIALRPATRVAITVVGTDNKAAPSVKVAVLGFYRTELTTGGSLPMHLRDELTQTTDASGQCVFSDMPQEASLNVRVADPWYFGESVSVETKHGEFVSALPIRVSKGVILSGRIVRGDNGQPVANFQVNDLARQPRMGWNTGTQTDSDGRFRFTQVHPGTHMLSAMVSAPLSSEFIFTSPEARTLNAGEEAKDIEIKLVSGMAIHGTVTESVTGKPITGAHIIASNEPAGPMASTGATTNTAMDGSYTLQVPPGMYWVNIGGLASLGYSIPTTFTQRITPDPNGENRIDFVCPANPALAVKGRVVDEQGSPVAGAVAVATVSSLVIINGNANSYQTAVYLDRSGGSATTDTDGKFEIPHVTDNAVLRITKGNLRLTQPITIDATHRDLNLTLAKAPRGSILVHVVDENSQPVTGAPVTISWSNEDNIGFGTSQKTGVTGADGTFHATGLYTDFNYSVSIGGNGFTRASTRELKIEAGKETAPPPIVITKADSFIAGVVLDEKNQAVPGVMVMASGRGSSGNARTDMEGRFRINGLVTGSTVMVHMSMLGQGNMPTEQIPAGTDNAVLMYLPNASPSLPARRGVGAR